MFSTSVKIAFGYILLIVLLFGTIGYIYRQMDLLTASSGTEEIISVRRKATHQIILQLYDAEIIGQTLRAGQSGEYSRYRHAMKQVGLLIDSLQRQLTDTLQQMRLDTVRTLLRLKEQNMLRVMEIGKKSLTDELYSQQIDSMILLQDSILNYTHVRRRIVTHHSTYTIHHKPKKFFRRLADLFSPGEADSTQVSNVVQEEYTDTIDDTYNPVDTIASMLATIQYKVFQSRQEQQRTFEERIAQLRVAGGLLSQRVNQLLETIEADEQVATERKIMHEQEIREQAAWTMAIISILAVLLVLVFFIIIWRDITRSTHYRIELEKAKLYAENLLASREKLMLTITHDIKAPVGSIIGYIDLLLRLVNERRQLFYLHSMQDSARHLLDLVTSLLDYHRLEAGKMDLHPVTFNPHELFSHIYTSFLSVTRKKGLTLIFEKQPPLDLVLEGDPFRIRQIAENLLSNALKFTEQGKITLCASYEHNSFCFSVSDTGCGMTPHEQERVFQAFTRLRSAQGQEGFGLGLSITKKLVELLKGEIRIESMPGAGSTFWVSVPVREVQSSVSVAQGISKLPESRQHILLIDDDRIQLNLTESMIRDLYASLQASNIPIIRCCNRPEDVCRLLCSEPVDIIFTDIQMPAMNGFELLKSIRNLGVSRERTVPVIAITARSDMNEEDFRSQGFAGCLYKPFNQYELLTVLHNALQVGKEETVGVQKETLDFPPDPKTTFDFTPLTAFSGDDPQAAHRIIGIFIDETEKNCERIRQALKKGDMELLCSTAHKMLPAFTMIGFHEAVLCLQWLEIRRKESQLTSEAHIQAEHILQYALRVVRDARDFLEKKCYYI